MSERLVPVGEIVSTHGIEGWLKVKPYNPQTAVFSAAREIFLEKAGVMSMHDLQMARLHKGHFLVKIRGIDGIGEAAKWVGFVLSVAEETLQPLAPGEYYHYQAIGLEVFDVAGERLGVVTRIWSKPGGDLYVVSAEGGREYLIPAVKDMIEKVDLDLGRITVSLPGGLLDL